MATIAASADKTKCRAFFCSPQEENERRLRNEELCKACEMGDIEQVKSCLQKGANLCFHDRKAEKLAKDPEILKILEDAEETNALAKCKYCDAMQRLWGEQHFNGYCEKCMALMCPDCGKTNFRNVKCWYFMGRRCKECYEVDKKNGEFIVCNKCGEETCCELEGTCFFCP